MHRVIAAGILVALTAGPAWANPLQLELVGRVRGECRLAATTSVLDLVLDLGALRRNGNVDLPFRMNCNVPFDYRLSAERGALGYDGEAVKVNGPFAREIPYWVEVVVPLRDGNRSEIRFRCAGSDLAGGGRCGRGDSGTSIAPGASGRLVIRWSMPDLPLLAGRYRERLQFTVTPRP